VNEFSAAVYGSGPQDVMDILLVTQYFDMLKDVGMKSGKENTMFLPHGPSAVQALRSDLKNNFVPGMARKGFF